MSMEQIRRRHKVPARRGAKVLAKTPEGEVTYATVLGAYDGMLRIRFVGEDQALLYHPDELEFCCQ